MAGGQAVWGLDVGKCALKAVKVRAGAEEKLDLLAVDYIEHEQILSQPDVDREALIAAALEKFLSRNDITDAPVVVSVPGQHTLARFSKLPPVEAKKIAEIVRYEAQQQIPFDMDEVIWDYQTFQEEDTPDIEVGIFAMKRDLIRDYLLHYENVGIEPVAVQSAPLALYNYAHFDGLLADKTTVLLGIGAETTDLVIASPYSLWTRTIPLGGNSFTETLVKAFKLSFSKAEGLKRTAATSKYARQVFQAMRPVFADLVQELQRSIGFYTSAHRDAELVKVVGMGSAFKLPGLQKYLEQNLGMDVERPDRFRKLELADGLDRTVLEENLLGFGVAYGLALQGLRQSKISTNLLPTEIARAAVWRKKRPFFGAAAAGLLLTAGAIWARQLQDMSTLDTNQGPPAAITSLEKTNEIITNGPAPTGSAGDQARQILAAAAKLREEYDKVAGKGKEELKKINEVVELQRNQAVWFKILHTVHAALPTPQPELAQAQGPEAYRAAIEAATDGCLARGKREQVFIEGFVPRFEPNLDAPEVAQGLEDLSGEKDPQVIPGEDRYGFRIKLSCRTPHEGRLGFVTQSFKKRLRELGRVPGQGFYINRIWLTKGKTIGAPSSTGAEPGSPGQHPKPLGRKPGPPRPGPPPPGGPAPKPETVEIIDPVTGEDMGSDWTFEMVFDVVLADLPPESAKAAGGAEGAPTGDGT